MLQDIYPQVFCNTYALRPVQDADYVFLFDRRTVAVRLEGETITLPRAETVADRAALRYLFSIDAAHFYLYCGEQVPCPAGFSYENIRRLRDAAPQRYSFAAFTAFHLHTWYADNRFCGRCGGKTEIDRRERAVVCPVCGNIVYPKISPAVIVGVTDGDRLLMTKYAGREYGGWALVAGYCEIGETPEDTVRREVMEETGLRVKNIRYYKSQPWGIDSNLLLGFFAEVDGSRNIRMDTAELAVAEWRARAEIEPTQTCVTLTQTLTEVFRRGLQS